MSEPLAAPVPREAVEPKAEMQLVMPADWQHIRQIREFLYNSVLSFGKARDFADRCAMCASELLENAVKYSVPDSEISVSVRIDFSRSAMTVAVENQTEPEQAAELERIFEQVSLANPLESYVVRLRQAGDRDDSSSQLGLGRIRAEGQGWIRCELVAADRVRMTVGVPEKRSIPGAALGGGKRYSDPPAPPPAHEGGPAAARPRKPRRGTRTKPRGKR
ncbi:MAG: ATP-binding protein [Myxococcales bacterium]|nr:ATP-binding protein [Myxococcales bacterium]